MPPAMRQGGSPMLPKAARKERLLTALTRMNDRDTQKAAAEDLLAIVLVSAVRRLALQHCYRLVPGRHVAVFAWLHRVLPP